MFSSRYLPPFLSWALASFFININLNQTYQKHIQYLILWYIFFIRAMYYLYLYSCNKFFLKLYLQKYLKMLICISAVTESGLLSSSSFSKSSFFLSISLFLEVNNIHSFWCMRTTASLLYYKMKAKNASFWLPPFSR